jgi:predicted ATPase/DNA-binding winged helix-turn-helix (wHTH) protein
MRSSANIDSREVFTFGPFELVPNERSLTIEARPISLGSRAFDILVALVERAPEVVSQRELISRAWPDLVVVDASLRVHLVRLRKTLGCGKNGVRYITNVPGRGYSFVKPVRRLAAFAEPVSQTTPAGSVARRDHLPSRPIGVVGRDQTVAEIRSLLSSRRFVSLIGPGGIGKTTVALLVAHALQEDFPRAVHFVDLASITREELVVSAVASAVGMARMEDTLSGLVSWLSSRRLVVVLDNCEHVIGAAADLAERLHQVAPRLHLLATSRETLRVSGEHIYLLKSLAAPPPGNLTYAEAVTWPAVKLFMDRAAMSGHTAPLRDEDADMVAEICRQLDGIALAIELAASRVGSYGLIGTANLLRNRFKLLLQGRRSAIPRHQTLTAMLEWSYNLLTENERRALNRLSVFVGSFTLHAAGVVAADSILPSLDIDELLGSLIEKSLLSVSVDAGMIEYRLLEITRNFASQKLQQSGEAGPVSHRHADYYATSAEIEPPSANGIAATPQLANIRAALEWSFGPSGDPGTGARLAVRAIPLFLARSLLTECRRWSRAALGALPPEIAHTSGELTLREALASSSIFTRGQVEDIGRLMEDALLTAERLGENSRQLTLLIGLHTYHTRLGQFASAVGIARQGMKVAKNLNDPTSLAIASWMMGCAFHHAGDQTSAQFHLEVGFREAEQSDRSHFDTFGYDQRMRAMLVLSRVLWLRGYPDQSARVANEAIALAEQRESPVNLCIALLTVRPTLWRGDLDLAKQRANRLFELSSIHQFAPYIADALDTKGEIAVAEGDGQGAIELLRRCLELMRIENYHRDAGACYRALVEAHLLCGDVDAARLASADALAWAARTGEAVELPNMLRAHAAVLLASCEPQYAAAESALTQSLKEATRQGMLSIELKSATDLARLWRLTGRSRDGWSLLDPIYQRFAEGFSTPDLVNALHLLNELKPTDAIGTTCPHNRP